MQTKLEEKKMRRHDITKILSMTLLLLITFSVNYPLINMETAYLNQENSQDSEKNTSTPFSSADPQGLLQQIDFIPDDGERFSESLVDDSLWTYPNSSSYMDYYWGDGVANTQNTTTNQTWNPTNQQIATMDSVVGGSDDFDAWDVASISLDPALRERIFNPSDSDMNSTTVGFNELAEYTYSGDFYSDQLLINLHGFEDVVLNMYSSPPINYQHNGRFNLPLTYAGIFYNRPDLKVNRNLNAILIGDNVFDWTDWCFIDPQWDQLVFPVGFSEPTGDEFFPPLNNYLDDINNISKRDTTAPSVELSISQDIAILSHGYFDLNYTISDSNLKNAFYYLDDPLKKQLIFKDSLLLDEANDKLVPAFDTTGTIHLMLKALQIAFSTTY